MNNIKNHFARIEKELDYLIIDIEHGIKKAGFKSKKELADELNTSPVMITYCTNFTFDNNGNLRGSTDIWRQLECIIHVNIIGKLKELGLRK